MANSTESQVETERLLATKTLSLTEDQSIKKIPVKVYRMEATGKMVSKLMGKGELRLFLGDDLIGTYKANYGGFGGGAPPNGEYSAHTLLNRGPSGSYNKGMSKGNTGFSINIDPKFPTQRSLLRIHPDGNNPGTLGCIGLSEDESILIEFRDKIKLP